MRPSMRTHAFIAVTLLCFGTLTVLGLVAEETPQNDAVPADTFRLYKGKDYTREKVEIKITSYKKDKVYSLRETEAWHRASSVKWNLSSGVIVVLYSEEDGTGRQYSMWRSGTNPNLSENRFNDAVEGWAWYKK